MRKAAIYHETFILSRTMFNIFVIFIICVSFFTEGVLKNNPPKIEINGTEYVVKSQSNFNVICLGNSPITWAHPIEAVEDSSSKIEVTTTQMLDAQYQYRANLVIRNASFVDTGYYYCHEIKAEKDAEGKSSKIYIYVRDEEHLSTLTNDVEFISAPINSDVIIPCRPTSPDVNVTLNGFSGYMTFNPRLGFNIKTSLYTIHVSCKFTRNGKIEEVAYIISVYPTPTSVERPSIDVANNSKTSVGQTIVLNCTVKIERNVYFEMTWDVPDKEGVQSGRISYTKAYIDPNRHELGWSALTIHNVTLKDAGNYTCKVEDHVHNKNYVSKEIIVT